MEEENRKFFQITTDRMYTALEAFYLWKKMHQMMNINEVGKDKAEENVEVFKKHWDFFHTVQNSTYKSFVTDLAVFFDAEKYEDTFSLGKLIDLTKQKISTSEYENLIKEIELIKRNHGVKINFLLELRNTEVSHQEINRKRRFIVYKDIEELFLAVQQILNLIAKNNDGSFTVWNHVSDNIINSFEWVMENLTLGEKQRLKEIKLKYGVSIDSK